MKKLLVSLLLILTVVSLSEAAGRPAVIFSQDVVAMNADGSLLPQVKVDPQGMTGMQAHEFDLGRQRRLRIETNINDAEQRGLNDVVTTVRRCYHYIETATGQQLERGVLLYLIELEEIPYAYSFRASYADAAQWGEVRLALIKKGAPLSGAGAPPSLTDLLYDTLPHELGHDVLGSIPQLLQDVDGQASQHTRWFSEGICEVLAKGFSQHENPALYRSFVALRKVDTVLEEAQMQTDMLEWAQNNNNGRVYESDLYGAAMLTMLAWTESITLTDLLTQIQSRSEPVRGNDLVAMMQQTTGRDMTEMLRHAHAYGRRLNERILLARLAD